MTRDSVRIELKQNVPWLGTPAWHSTPTEHLPTRLTKEREN